jgi:outer membrane protein OmpA-like peptidoglycan-associated protein
MSDLFQKANQILDTSQGALESIAGATDNINMITGKINTGHGTIGKLINDTTLYNQATAGVSAMSDNATAMKHNFLLRGFFKDRGYMNPAEIQLHAIAQLPNEQIAKRFTFDPRSLFDRPDSAKLKNQKSLDEAGQYLQGQPFGLAVIAASAGMTGDTDKELVLSEARSFVLRKYLVTKFPMDDTHLKTIGLGKSANSRPEGSIEILVYAAVPKTQAKK